MVGEYIRYITLLYGLCVSFQCPGACVHIFTPSQRCVCTWIASCMKGCFMDDYVVENVCRQRWVWQRCSMWMRSSEERRLSQGQLSTPLAMTLSRIACRVRATKVGLNAEGFLATLGAALQISLWDKNSMLRAADFRIPFTNLGARKHREKNREEMEVKSMAKGLWRANVYLLGYALAQYRNSIQFITQGPD